MSRTRSTSGNGPSNPIKKRLTFVGDTGKIRYYDSNIKQNVEMDTIDLIMVDMRSSVSGFNDDSNSNIFSNMVKNTKKEILNVRTWKGNNKEIASGLYSEIKEKVNKAGGDFTRNLIALAKIDDRVELVSLDLSRSSLQGFMEFNEELNDSDYYENILRVTPGESRKKGKIKYIVPAFEFVGEVPAKMVKLAEEADVELQAYFDYYENGGSGNTQGTSDTSETKTQEASPANTPGPKSAFDTEEEDDLPF